MSEFTLYNDDCLNVLKSMEDNSIDSCVTDPPYGLSFMGKHWDYDVPPKEIWIEVFRVLKPGGHLLSFGGSRTYHRMACAIEDAGFEIRDQIMWIYGSGFPKSHDISKAIDKAANAERKVIGKKKGQGNIPNDRGNWGLKPNALVDITEPETDDAKEWEGWGTALKPAHEPIVLARKPLSEKTVAENVLKWGTGAINIDETRIKQVTVGNGNLANNPHLRKSIKAGKNINPSSFELGGVELYPNSGGRWPANVIHDGSDEVVENFPYSKSGKLTSDQQLNGGFKGAKNCYGTAQKGVEVEYPANEGSAARFFYCAKASKSDRDEGLDSMPKQFQAGAEFRPNHMEKALEGSTGNPYGRWDPRQNNHPTVKPTKLMEYLVKLITPKNGVILDPFMGSGSTGKSCGLSGYKFVGMELDKDYFKIAKKRIEHAYGKKGLENYYE